MKKAPAQDRTVNMFSSPEEEAVINQAEIEVEKDGRVPAEEDVNRTRDKYFQYQEWATKHFADRDATSNEYRLSLKEGFYLLETILKMPGGREAYGSSGVMIREADIIKITQVFVDAARAKKAKENR
jgi:hypothetical protein